MELWGTSGYDSTILNDCEIVDFGFGDEIPVVHKKKRSKSKHHGRGGTSALGSQALTYELGAAGEEVRAKEGWGVVHMDEVMRACFERCLDEVGIVKKDAERLCWVG